MSPKHTEKTIGILMILVLMLTLSLGFTLNLIHSLKDGQSEKEMSRISIHLPFPIPAIDFETIPVPMAEMQTEISDAERYASYVDEITSQIYTDVDPLRVKAIIYHESRYVPDIVNEITGVIGLTQINPKWHSERATSLGVNDLSDPYGNILVCCDILHELQQTNSESYALNVYAGGYPYAEAYLETKSPFELELDEIMSGLNDGTIVIGGEYSAKS